ncbi:molecular chaperone TorD family protein [Neobacillus rhizosphaerae]|uniref:TorD/DmsD family molecular chaperone n=1 Tax=Neobacillus rhizosphaerae TaxID=2880965 RepID=UPI003D2D1B0C
MANTAESVHMELQPLLNARKKFYQLLHILFQMPTNNNEYVEICKKGNLQELEEMHEGGKILSGFFQRLSNDYLKKEREEYQRLFLGPGPLAAPPWESYYRSKEQLLFEEWTYQVREQYHQFGLKYVRENNEPDDHLLLELEFMINLIDLCLLESNPDRFIELISCQQHFLENHLTVWIPYFCKRVIQTTNSQLFLGAAMLLEDFINDDLTTLYEVKEALADV